ncbi:Armadillo-like helical [Forsythia ovata]|uniref:Armadillo-like helical n=1 Tax=Forsythia ovata TaxID=205694 RepID=A0ABD1P3G9_9LAMI
MRGNFIVLFNQIFEALCKLSADSDPNVQSAAYLLDRLVKDIVTEGDQFRFQIFKGEDKLGIGAGRMVPIETSCAYMAKERILLPEKLAKLKSNIGADEPAFTHNSLCNYLKRRTYSQFTLKTNLIYSPMNSSYCSLASNSQ